MATASLPESRTKMIYEEQEGGIKTGWVTGDTFLALEINGNTVTPVTFTASAPASVKTTFASSGATAASATTTWVAVLGKKASFDGGNVVCSYSGQNGSLKGLEGFDYMVASSTGEAPDFHFGNGKQLSYLLRIKMPEGVGKLEFNTAANGPEWTAIFRDARRTTGRGPSRTLPFHGKLPPDRRSISPSRRLTTPGPASS